MSEVSIETAVRAALAMIKAVHPNEPLDDEKVDVWMLLLDNMPPDRIVQATRLALETSPYPPKPYDVRQALVPPQPSPEEGWAEFKDSMREPADRYYVDGDRRYEIPRWRSDIIREAGEPIAADVVALVEYGEGDEYTLRRIFCSRYERLRDEAIHKGEWHRLDMGTFDPDKVLLSDVGLVPKEQVAIEPGDPRKPLDPPERRRLGQGS